MPSLEPPSPSSEGAVVWQGAVKNLVAKQWSNENALRIFRQLKREYYATPREIADAVINIPPADGWHDPPHIFRYAEILLYEKMIGVDNLLLALLHQSRFGANTLSFTRDNQFFPSREERIFYLILKYLEATGLPSSAWRLPQLVYSITQWLNKITEYEMNKQLAGGGLHAIHGHTCTLYEELATLTLAVFGSARLRNLSQQAWWKKRRHVVVAKMEAFDTHVLQWMHSHLAGRLTMLTGLPPFLAYDDQGNPIFSERQVMEAIQDVPVVNSRAGLFIWLDALLCARPLTDDMYMIAYLHGRYGADFQSMVVDVLVASFDVLTNTLLRGDSKHSIEVTRSFICNKVPTLLTILAGMAMSPMPIENYVQIAFMPEGMIYLEPPAPTTAGAVQARDMLKATRLEFLQACALHGLVGEICVASIVQDPALTLPRITKYTKEGLVAQCANNISRVGTLVEELRAMQGNAGAIAGCIVETIIALCISKDTMSLKTVCIEMIKKIPLLDIVMQYTQPRMILMPLCALLNEWQHDQDQTEFAPAYEEFATILLFALATIYRYDLSHAEIGLIPEGFMAELLAMLTTSKPVTGLEGEQSVQLGKWLEGLYTVDDHGETSGIGDDVMRQCPPQSFYMLVPTLFEQSVLACRVNALSMKTVKGGLELLLEPFLLPSLIMGLRWLAKPPWTQHNDADILLGMLDKLLKPSSSSQETQAMHKAILAMVATPLSTFLQHLESKRNDRKDKIAELLALLRPHLNQQRNLYCSKKEMDAWMPIRPRNRPEHHRLVLIIRPLIEWASNPAQPPNPPLRYTYRQYALLCQVLNSTSIVRALLLELRRKQEAIDLSIALDVGTALLCAPTSDSLTSESASRASGSVSKIREMIRVQSTDIATLLKRPETETEALVRLSRRFQAQLSVSSVAMPIQGLGFGALTDDVTGPAGDQTSSLAVLDQPLGLSDSDAQELANMTANADAMGMNRVPMFDEMRIDIDQAPQNDDQVDDLQTAEEDIFADLDMNMDLGDDFFA